MTEHSNVSADEINWAMIIHVSAIAGFLIPLGHILFPAIMWLSKKGKSKFIDIHGAEVMNFQLNITIVLLIISLIFLAAADFKQDTIIEMLIIYRGILFLSYATLAILFMLAVTRAAVKTSKGEKYRYPYLFIRIFSA